MSLHEAKTSRFFKHLGIGFAAVALILLTVVMYMALSRATIIVSAQEEEISADLIVTAREANLRPGDVRGKFASAVVSREAPFTTSGEGGEVTAKAGGEIVIYNKHLKDQQLIATTRFLSKDGVLFRLQKGVTAPAGGSVKGYILADKEGKSGEVEASRFTIPGLSTSLQSKIYGETAEKIAGGTAKVAKVTQKDIDEAFQNMRSSLVLEAKEKLAGELTGNFSGVAYADKELLAESSVEPDALAENFVIKMELEVIGVAYGEELEAQAGKTLSSLVSSDKKLNSSNLQALEPVLERYDLENKVANLRAEIKGKVVVQESSPVFDRGKLGGMTTEEVKEYLLKYGKIQDVDIRYFPFWLDRVPRLRDHIKIIIK